MLASASTLTQQRHRDVVLSPHLDAEKVRGRHSNDGERAAIQADRACQHIGIASKFALPEWIAYDGPWHSAFWPVIGPRDGAAHHGSDAERLKKIPAHTEAFGVTRLAATREVKAVALLAAAPKFVNSGSGSKKA